MNKFGTDQTGFTLVEIAIVLLIVTILLGYTVAMFPRQQELKQYRAVDRQMDEVMVSADLTFKGSDTSDFVSIQVWGRKGAKQYLLWQVCRQMNYVDTRREFVLVCRMFPMARTKLIEEAANGAALIADLKATISGLVPVNPGASKFERAQIGSVPAFEALNIYLPTPDKSPWVTHYIAEHVSFPASANDDQVDATSQYLLRVTGKLTVDVANRLANQFSWMEG